eukprot:COSAG01_NODE_13641_length_1554_cov_3.266667_2_plen_209_part_00
MRSARDNHPEGGGIVAVTQPDNTHLGHPREASGGRGLPVTILAHPEAQRDVTHEVSVLASQREVKQPDGLLLFVGCVAGEHDLVANHQRPRQLQALTRHLPQACAVLRHFERQGNISVYQLGADQTPNSHRRFARASCLGSSTAGIGFLARAGGGGGAPPLPPPPWLRPGTSPAAPRASRRNCSTWMHHQAHACVRGGTTGLLIVSTG